MKFCQNFDVKSLRFIARFKKKNLVKGAQAKRQRSLNSRQILQWDNTSRTLKKAPQIVGGHNVLVIADYTLEVNEPKILKS